MHVPEGIRLMVFAPHPDDEALAAAGLMQRVLERNGRVCVVYVTNGDGYAEGVRLKLKKTHASRDDFIEYGRRRQEEAVHALCELGLDPGDAVFLGFPDDGIDDLWGRYWSKIRPYTSPYTRFDRPLRKSSDSRWVKYVGVDLTEEMERTLKSFVPDWVVLPDPRDFHPDHSATGVFVLDALKNLNQDGNLSFAGIQVFTYLVHYRDYPHSRTWANEINTTGVGGSPSAARVLSSTQWLNLPLTAAELDGKERSLMAHQSQHVILGGFIQQFLHPCELFGRLDSAQVMLVPQEYAAHTKRPSS